MATFKDYWNELTGEIPKLSPLLAQKFVQRAWGDIQQARRWSFLIAEGYLYAPAAISTGTVAVTQFSTSVQADAAAKAALDAVVLNAGAPLTTRQFRLSGAPIYNISAYDNVTGILTLDRMYMEATNVAAAYEVYRCFYTPPLYGGAVDFLRWLCVADPVSGYKIRGKNLARTRAEVDARDASRTYSGDPIWVAGHHVQSDGTPVFELWPHQRSERVYTTPFERRGQELAAAGVLPGAIDSALLMDGARIKAYTWASANAGRFPELQGTNWLQLRREVERTYSADLQRAKVQDEETFVQTWGVFDGDDSAFPASETDLQARDPFGY
jgi:hypothetical protein